MVSSSSQCLNIVTMIHLLISYNVNCRFFSSELICLNYSKGHNIWTNLQPLIFSVLGGSLAVLLCNIETSELKLCHDAITGENPPSPDMKCCDVVHRCSLTCLCDYKFELPLFGINPANAMALPVVCDYLWQHIISWLTLAFFRSEVNVSSIKSNSCVLLTLENL